MRTAETDYPTAAARRKRDSVIDEQPVAMWAGAIFGDFADDGSMAVAGDPVVQLYVDNDRLVAQCPFCPNAELGSENDHRFFCNACGNAEVGGAYVKTVLP